MAQGMGAREAVLAVIAGAEHTDYRQLMAVDKTGRTAIHSGSKSLGVHAEFLAEDAAAAGNIVVLTVPARRRGSAARDD